MKTKALLSLTAIFVATCISQSAFAKSISCDLEEDRCSRAPLSPTDSDKSLFLGDQVNQALEDLYQKNLALGKDTKVVLIARMGQNTKKFKILKDSDGKDSIQTIYKRILDQSREAQMSSSQNSIAGDSIDYSTLMNNINKEDELKYSHLGIAFRNFALKSPEDKTTNITGPGTGKWAFYHLLYSCDRPEGLEEQGEYIKKSHIFKGTVHSFFFDQLSDYKAQFIVPNQSVQNALEDMLLKKRQVYNFQQDHYNAAAKFEDLDQQNSNQFVLEAVAAASRPDGQVLSRESAIGVLKETGFSGSKIMPTGMFSVLKMSFVQKLVSKMMPTLCLKSQPELKKYGMAEIVTSNSVLNWMRRNKLVDEVFETGLEKGLVKEIEKYNKPVSQNVRDPL